MELNAALEKIKGDKTLLGKFYVDPQGELKALGVDTGKLDIKNARDAVRGGTSVCVQVGEIVGVSVGQSN